MRRQGGAIGRFMVVLLRMRVRTRCDLSSGLHSHRGVFCEDAIGAARIRYSKSTYSEAVRESSAGRGIRGILLIYSSHRVRAGRRRSVRSPLSAPLRTAHLIVSRSRAPVCAPSCARESRYERARQRGPRSTIVLEARSRSTPGASSPLVGAVQRSPAPRDLSLCPRWPPNCPRPTRCWRSPPLRPLRVRLQPPSSPMLVLGTGSSQK